MSTLDRETLRTATLIMADWLEHRQFNVRNVAGCPPDEFQEFVKVWYDGFRRAVYELRTAATDMPTIPDDISELDT